MVGYEKLKLMTQRLKICLCKNNLLILCPNNKMKKKSKNSVQKIEEESKTEDNGAVSPHDKQPELNLEYLKNVVLEYFQCLARGDCQQADVLEHVIFTILRVTPQERSGLEQARDNYTIWSKAKYILTGGYFYPDQLEKKRTY